MHIVNWILGTGCSGISLGSERSSMPLLLVKQNKAHHSQIVSISAVNAPVINALLKSETWASSNQSCSCSHPSRFCSHHSEPHNASADRTMRIRAVDADFEMVDIETQSKRSTSELVKGLNAEITQTSWTAKVQSRRWITTSSAS